MANKHTYKVAGANDMTKTEHEVKKAVNIETDFKQALDTLPKDLRELLAGAPHGMWLLRLIYTAGFSSGLHAGIVGTAEARAAIGVHSSLADAFNNAFAMQALKMLEEFAEAEPAPVKSINITELETSTSNTDMLGDMTEGFPRPMLRELIAGMAAQVGGHAKGFSTVKLLAFVAEAITRGSMRVEVRDEDDTEQADKRIAKIHEDARTGKGVVLNPLEQAVLAEIGNLINEENIAPTRH